MKLNKNSNEQQKINERKNTRRQEQKNIIQQLYIEC